MDLEMSGANFGRALHGRGVDPHQVDPLLLELRVQGKSEKVEGRIGSRSFGTGARWHQALSLPLFRYRGLFRYTPENIFVVLVIDRLDRL